MTDIATNSSSSNFARQFNKWMLILGKLPKLIVLLKVAKLGKVFVLLASVMVSVIAYAVAMNSWAIGIGFVYLLLIHELGHCYAARRCGVTASWPIFIPFVGAAIFIKKFTSLREEAYVAIAGPAFGIVATLPFAIAFAATGEKLWSALLYLGIFLNAFNLIPLRPLDGGRMTAICGAWFKLIGFGALALLSIVIHEPVMLYVWVLVLTDIAFPLWWRTPIGIFLTTIMIVLMSLGYSSQPWWADTIDASFACVICLTYYWRDDDVSKGKPDPLAETWTDEHTIRPRERMSWAVGWITATAACIGALVALAPFVYHG